MKILITGANGYIGSNLFNFLSQKQNLEVFGLVRESNRVNKSFIKADLLDFENLKEIFERYSFDIVIDCSGKADLNSDSKESDFLANIQMSLNLVKLSREFNINRYIFLSTYVVYGFEYEINESNYLASNPFEWYSKSKVICENMIEESGLNHLILRLPNVVKNEKNSLILELFKSRKLDNKIEVFGKGEVYRNFLIIDDLLEFIYKNLSTKVDFFAPYSFIIKIKDLAKEIANFTNCENVRFIDNKKEMQKVLTLESFKISKESLRDILKYYN